MNVDERGISAGQLQKLALRYSEDSQILLKAGRWDSAYYLAGYAAECALKACIAKHIHQAVPSRKFIDKFYAHKLDGLLDLAGAKAALQEQADEVLKRNWTRIVSTWSSEVRYSDSSEALAREMVMAVNDPEHGVLQWLSTLW